MFIVKERNQNTITETSGKISSNIWGSTSGSINSTSYSKKTISLGSEYFYLYESVNYASMISDGDDVVILGDKY